ncbi:deoxyhypusine hydroxylase [Capsaspora owczarzaki ATCC 30864]|nr:deoxyhypusine hydroxylase [Capsaspora owczarzaki ATCC 30864]|eukprot:XP_004349226.1 deoxyhypusine hydroxylase [Capsaspora owczarzaki ATCC 30864]
MNELRDSPATLVQHVPSLRIALNDPERPLHERFRVLFTLKNIGGAAAIDAIAECFKDDSALLKHELAYCLGQLQDTHAIPCLTQVLQDTNQEPMVRHEAAEALGAIGTPEVLATLVAHLEDPVVEVSETCQIAVARVKWENGGKQAAQQTGDFSENPYDSVDPAPPSAPATAAELRGRLLDTELTLFERYRALFALRNKGDPESVLAIVDGFDDKSALFRHEIAYVLGQMQHPVSVPGLIKVLERGESESSMVRHECAEALGSIATDECLPVLERYKQDNQRVVKESCVVALDMHAFENSGEFLTLEQGVEKIVREVKAKQESASA